MRIVSFAIPCMLVCCSAAQAQMTFLSDERAVTARVQLDYIPGLESYYEQYQPISDGPLGTYSIYRVGLEDYPAALDTLGRNRRSARIA